MSDTLLQRVQRAFTASFGAMPALVARAPGRVNLIGEHTDYNDGFVLPCAIDYETLVAIRPRADAHVCVTAADYRGETDHFHLDDAIGHHPDRAWANYVRGVLVQLRAAGMPARGADLAIAGNLPRGAGLSSSASLEVALALAFRTLHGPAHLDATALATIAQRAESEFVGNNCGIMDQLISARGAAGHALLIDCRTLASQQIALPPEAALMIVHSHIERGLVDSEYNARRAQCEAAARHFGVARLRDVTPAMLETHGTTLDPVVLRRARHIVTENARTRAAAAALAAGDLPALGPLMAASHASMRDDFAITVPAIDTLADLLQHAIGTAGGARMTGGGFGGCVIGILPAAMVDDVRRQILQHYRAPNGQAGTVHVCRPAAGAGIVA